MEAGPTDEKVLRQLTKTQTAKNRDEPPQHHSRFSCAVISSEALRMSLFTLSASPFQPHLLEG